MHFSLFETQLGECGIVWHNNLVVATNLPEVTRAATATRLSQRTGAIEGSPPEVIQMAMDTISSLLTGEQVDLNHIECSFEGVDTFEMAVYERAREIPVGKTITYGELAVDLGNKQLARRVGRALGRNPLPVIVPCHRVVGANDKLTGFSAYGGIATKQKMLSIERGHVGQTLSLFDDPPGSH